MNLKFLEEGRLPRRLVLALAISLVLSCLMWTFSSQMVENTRSISLPKIPGSIGSCKANIEIPNIVHFVYLVPPDSGRDLVFNFAQFLSVYSTFVIWKPELIYFHTNVAESTIIKIMEGKMGRWTQAVLQIPTIRVNYIPYPAETNTGKKIKKIEHVSDFARVQVVNRFGGTYIDLDAYAIKDIADLRHSGFKAIVGRQHLGEVNSGTFLAVANSTLIEEWEKDMHTVYDGSWTGHSNKLLTRLSEKVASNPNEVLILEQAAFAPDTWLDDSQTWLFQIHEDWPSNLDILRSELESGENSQGSKAPKEEIQKPPSERGNSLNYILHSFMTDEPEKAGYKGVTPAYVLSRQSVFSREVYPVARSMWDAGIITVNDL